VAGRDTIAGRVGQRSISPGAARGAAIRIAVYWETSGAGEKLPPPGAAHEARRVGREEQNMPTVVDRHEVQKLVEQGAQLVDVMSAREYREEHLPGALNLPLKTLSRESVAPLDPRRAVIVYCHDYQ
jgi:hypothetical protein